jgi:hypothetical protein
MQSKQKQRQNAASCGDASKDQRSRLSGVPKGGSSFWRVVPRHPNRLEFYFSQKKRISEVERVARESSLRRHEFDFPSSKNGTKPSTPSCSLHTVVYVEMWPLSKPSLQLSFGNRCGSSDNNMHAIIPF